MGMRILRKMRRQTCVYWAPGQIGVEGNVETWEDPVELLVRWEDCVEQYIDRNGTPQTSSAKVFVGVDVVTLGVLWLPPENVLIPEGQGLAQVVDEDNPFKNPGAFEIRKFDKLPILKVSTEDDFLRTVWL